MMTVEIRQASITDLPAVGAVKGAVWPDEAPPNLALCQHVLTSPVHSTHVALVDGVVAGFVSGFLTQTAAGVPRWEVDLLAVHPAYRGRKLATALILENLSVARALRAQYARGLVQVSNAASQRAFLRAGFSCDAVKFGLYVTGENVPLSEQDVPQGLHIVPVATLNYRGVWLEGVLDASAFAYASQMRQQNNLDIAGVVIALDQEQTISAALNSGYRLVERFAWWISPLTKA